MKRYSPFLTGLTYLLFLFGCALIFSAGGAEGLSGGAIQYSNLVWIPVLVSGIASLWVSYLYWQHRKSSLNWLRVVTLLLNALPALIILWFLVLFFILAPIFQAGH